VGESTGARRFVGRASELARLDALLRGALDGRPAAVLVAGEAGVGKSRLLGELYRMADPLGVRVVEGACLPLGEAAPYVPIVSILRSVAHAVPPAALPAILGPGRAELARLVPEFGERGAAAPPATLAEDTTAQARLFELVAGALDRLARSAPLIVAIEDVHWADRSTRDLADFLIRGLRDQPILLLMTLRTDELDAEDDIRAWVAEVDRLPRVERLDLGPLPREDVATLIGAIIGREPAPDLVDRFTARAVGNPFLVEELAEAAAAGGAASELPAHLRELLLARLAGLDDTAQAVLRAAAAIGTHLDDELLADCVSLPAPNLMAALRAGLERGILVRTDGGIGRSPGFAFRHALLRDAIYGELFPSERVRLHGAYAAALERRAERDPARVPAAELAYHSDAAGQPERALPAHLRAGRDATRMFAFAEARRHYERALELWAAVDDAEAAAGTTLTDLLERASDAAAYEGDYRSAVARIDEAIERVDPATEPAQAGALREKQRWLLWEAGETEAATAAVREALRLIPADPPSSERARVLAHAAGLDMMAGRPRPALGGARDAIRVARAASALPEEALGLGIQGWAVATLGDVEAGVASFREGMRIAEMLGSVDGLALGYTNLASLLDRAGRTKEALAAALEGYAAVAQSGLARTFGGYLLGHAARMHYHLGTWDQAETLIAEGIALGPVPKARLFLLIQRARIAAAQGRSDVAASALGSALELESDLGGTEYAASLLEARVEAAAWAGRIAEARVAIDDALQVPTAGRLPDPALAWVGAMGMRIEADAAEVGRARRDEVAIGAAEARAVALVDWLRGWLPAGDLARQEAIARALEPRAAAIVALLEAEHARLIGRADPAAWRVAADAWMAIGRPFPAAYARARLGAALLSEGARAAAREALGEAHAAAARLGAVPLIKDIEGLGRLARIDLATPGIAHPPEGEGTADGSAEALGLTPREREVLRLVAAGWSNQEIADSLAISRKTASVHVSNILGKLGVSGRVEAAVAAARLGLGPIEAADRADDPRPAQHPAGRAVHQTLVFTDIVGSTALIAVIGDAAWRDLRRWHDATLRRLFEQHDGHEIDHAGDGFFVAFASAADAVACAQAIQRTLGEHRRTTGFAPAVRIGIHSGDAHPEGKAIAGLAVHVAARVAAQAEGGQILASDAAIHEARIPAGSRLTEVRLEGVPEPIAVALLPW
jgi:class 3 adenylate cyclase/tetratricopeptide (TPR) repeat protein